MAVLEQITQMKTQGLQTPQIIQSLKEQGVSPKEINEALSQSEIKTEVTGGQPGIPETNIYQNATTGAIPTQDPSIPQVRQPTNPIAAQQQGIQQQTQPGIQGTPPINLPTNTFATGELGSQSPQQPGMQDFSGMQQQPGMQNYNSTGIGPINAGVVPTEIKDPYAQQQQQIDNSGMQPSIGGTSMQDPQIQEQNFQSTVPEGEYPEYSPGQYYSEYEEQYPEYESPQATDIETINDISEQVAEEKIKQLKKDANLLIKFRKDSEEKIKEFEKRLEKIENIIEQLQLALIRKINNYGENIENLSKEMQNTRQTVSKMIDPLTDNIRELQKMTGKEIPEPEDKKEDKKESASRKKSSSKKSSTSFEDYLR